MDIVEIKQQVLQQIEKQRQEAINIAEYNKIIAYKDDKYLDYANKIGDLTIQIAKAQISQKDTTALMQQKSELTRLSNLRLNEIGFDAKSLIPQYQCPICKDTGINGNEYCSCFNNLMAQYLNNMSDAHSKNITFKDCDKADIKLLDIMKTICNQYPNQKYNKIVFCGPTGVGKSYLMQATANKFISNNVYTIFISATDLGQLFLKYHTAPISDKQTILDNLLNCEVLVIDDLGAEPKLKNVTNEYLLLIINHRNTTDKLTLITTNLSPEGIMNSYDERIFSRLFDKEKSLPINITGKDKRLKI